MAVRPAALAFCLGVLLLTGSSTRADAQEAAGLPAGAVAKLESAIGTYMAANHVPGLSIALVIDGHPAWSRGFGQADVENAVPATAATAYRSASIGKTMTATAAMRLVDAGKLELDADIRRYCPAFPAGRWTISVRQLLSHQSGIRHYGGPRDREEQASTVHYANVIDAMAPFKNDPLQFQPGTRYLYSTYGYDVLGCVMQGAAAKPFLDVMRTQVWEPAGMHATRDDDPAALIDRRASGYALVDGALRNAQHVDMSNRLPAGGYVTTVDDLARFEAALLDGTLIAPKTLQRMLTPSVLVDGTPVPYGLGWGMELEPWHDDTWAFHGGSSPGASGMVALMPRHRFGVAILANLEDLPGRNELVERITRIALGFDGAGGQ
jgi:CubicO group peptidase (beta-lactamase class C family)